MGGLQAQILVELANELNASRKEERYLGKRHLQIVNWRLVKAFPSETRVENLDLRGESIKQALNKAL